MVLVEVLRKTRIEINGYIRTYQAGDKVNIGKQYARQLAGQDRVKLPDHVANRELPEQDLPVQISMMRPAPGIRKHPATLVWNGRVPLPYERIAEGFKLLETWEIAVPMFSYTTLASNIGTDEDREKTQAVVRDLRVPVYETGLMFLRHSDATEQLMRCWEDEEIPDGDPRLAFLRAVYQIKPLILALPVDWRGGDGAI